MYRWYLVSYTVVGAAALLAQGPVPLACLLVGLFQVDLINTEMYFWELAPGRACRCFAGFYSRVVFFFFFFLPTFSWV